MIEKLKGKGYRVISKIGAGGMATIYKAVDTKTNKYVAVKVLAPDQKDNIVHKKRFLSEIKLTKQVDSPYVIKIYDSWWEDDFQYISMELIEGHILKNYINSHTRLTPEETVEFAKQLALGFEEIHQNGIIHRDIKSQNVMVAAHGQIKIIDFGIARNKESEQLTRDDSVVGSVQYMAPELAEQRPASIQSDIYAFGILMYEMLTGDVPHKGTNPIDTLMKHKKEAVPYVSRQFSNVPNGLSNIIAKATNRDARARYKTMHEVYTDLTTCLNLERNTEKVYSNKDKPEVSFMSFINSKKMFYSLIAFSILLVLAIIIIVIVLVV